MEFEVDGKTYSASKLNAKKQFHIARRLMGVLSGSDGDESKVISAISSLKDEDMDYCLFGLLSCLKMKLDNGVGYAPICVDNVLAYDDMSLKTMLSLAFRSFTYNFEDFFQSLPSILEEMTPSASDQ